MGQADLKPVIENLENAKERTGAVHRKIEDLSASINKALENLAESRPAEVEDDLKSEEDSLKESLCDLFNTAKSAEDHLQEMIDILEEYAGRPSVGPA